MVNFVTVLQETDEFTEELWNRRHWNFTFSFAAFVIDFRLAVIIK